MAKLIGLFCAMVALIASLSAQAEPWSAIMRAGLAFLLGYILTQTYYVFFVCQVVSKRNQPISEEFKGENSKDRKAA